MAESDLDFYVKVAEYMVDPDRESTREKLAQARTEEASSEPAGHRRDKKDDDASAAEGQESEAGGEPTKEAE